MRRLLAATALAATALTLALSVQVHAQMPPVDGARPGNDIGTGMSMPRSNTASNLNNATTHSVYAPNLPAPPAGDDIQTLLLAARSALIAGRTGEAQEALERAETRALDRSVPYGGQNVPDSGKLVSATGRARAALAAGDTRGAIAVIDQAIPNAAAADIPH